MSLISAPVLEKTIHLNKVPYITLHIFLVDFKQMSSETMKTISTFQIKHNSCITKTGNPIDSRKSVGYFQAD